MIEVTKVDYLHLRYPAPRRTNGVTVAFYVDQDVVRCALAVTHAATKKAPADQFVKKTGREISFTRLIGNAEELNGKPLAFDIPLAHMNEFLGIRADAKNPIISFHDVTLERIRTLVSLTAYAYFYR